MSEKAKGSGEGVQWRTPRRFLVKTYWRSNANPYPGELIATRIEIDRRRRPRSLAESMVDPECYEDRQFVQNVTAHALTRHNARRISDSERFTEWVDTAQKGGGQ